MKNLLYTAIFLVGLVVIVLYLYHKFVLGR